MPEQSPISPPYKTACLLKKHGALDKASYSDLDATGTVSTASTKDTDVDSQTKDAANVIQLEHLSLCDVNQGKTTVTKTKQI